MKYLRLCFILWMAAFLLSGCSQDDQDTNDKSAVSATGLRKSHAGIIQHSPAEVAYIQSIRSRVDAQGHFDFGPDFVNLKGQVDWDLAAIPLRSTGTLRSLIVPILKANQVNALIHLYDSDTLHYFYNDPTLLKEPFRAISGTAYDLYDPVFTFYDQLLNDVNFDPNLYYDDIFDNPELGGCKQITTQAVLCTDLGHMPGDPACKCGTAGYEYCDDGYWIQNTDYVDCDLSDPSNGSGFTNNSGGGGTSTNGSGGNNGGGGDNVDPRLAAARLYVHGVCQFLSPDACNKLKYIVENAQSSDYCINIPMQISNLFFVDHSAPNIAAANCFVMSTSVQFHPSAPNTCDNPFSSEPLTDFADMYGEMQTGLLEWAGGYPGLDNAPCALTVAGYTSDEKNQILQAFKDHLGDPPFTGVEDIFPPNNPDLDHVNDLMEVLGNGHYPEMIPLIPDILTWDTFDNLPEIAEFIKDYPLAVDQDVKDMFQQAANISDKVLLVDILSLVSEDGEVEAIKAASMIFAVTNDAVASIEGPYDAHYHSVINPYIQADLNDPINILTWINYFNKKCARISKENPDMPKREVYFNASMEMVHVGLDLAGLIPGVGEVFDVTNGAIYLVQGDGVSAALSFSAAIPIIGWVATGGKYAIKGKWVLLLKADGTVDFGRKQAKKFRKALGLVAGDGKHAHHIIPWGLKDLQLVQKAAKSKNAFHINEVLNGIPLPSSNHLTGHAAYNSKLSQKLDNLNDIATSNEDAFQLLDDFIEDIRNLIIANPNMNLGQIADLID